MKSQNLEYFLYLSLALNSSGVESSFSSLSTKLYLFSGFPQTLWVPFLQSLFNRPPTTLWPPCEHFGSWQVLLSQTHLSVSTFPSPLPGSTCPGWLSPCQVISGISIIRLTEHWPSKAQLNFKLSPLIAACGPELLREKAPCGGEHNKGNNIKQWLLRMFPTIPHTSSEGKLGTSKSEGWEPRVLSDLSL